MKAGSSDAARVAVSCHVISTPCAAGGRYRFLNRRKHRGHDYARKWKRLYQTVRQPSQCTPVQVRSFCTSRSFADGVVDGVSTSGDLIHAEG